MLLPRSIVPFRLNRFLTRKLREYALKLRAMVARGAHAMDVSRAKTEMLTEVFKVNHW